MRSAPLATAALLLLLASDARAGERLVDLEPGIVHSGIATRADPNQTYDLYLPPGFDPDRRWPLLLVFDPRSRGRLAAEVFRAAAERQGWMIASSNETMSDTATMEHNVRAVNALWPDLMTRLPVDERRVYAAGFSGGAMLGWILGQRSGLLAGVVSVGGRLPEGFEGQPPAFASWLAAGTTDFNYVPTLELADLAARSDRPYRFEPFDGPHAWFDPEEADRALAWLEVVAMTEQRRAVDLDLARATFARDLAGAEGRIAAGDPLGAQRRLEAIAATYRGLLDVSAAETRLRQLAQDPALRQAEKDERWARVYEAGARRRFGEALALLRHEAVPPPLARLRAILNVPGMLAAASPTGARGDAGRRAVASAHSALAFYLTREMLGADELARAALALELATELRPGDAVAWYNLACARARLGRTEDALEALATSVRRGLPEGMRPPEQDPDLESLRELPAFARILAGGG
ncbi:MAG TPA: tetratricopeptide repeat protein [Thermoanaerobaculia bacterium]|nr:tetratricopeptide repeat protein [Thermoanaerobaculia bacterium]